MMEDNNNYINITEDDGIKKLIQKNGNGIKPSLNKEVLIKAIKSLNEEYRSLIVLRDIRGFSYWEISDMLNMKLGTVKSKISRAREALKKELIRMGYTGYSIDEE